jgi:hypothetical protein
MTSLDTVGNETLKWTFWVFLLLSFFLSLKNTIFLLFFSYFIYSLALFLISFSWAKDPHPEKAKEIAFFVVLFHSFLFLLGGVLGILTTKGFLKDLIFWSVNQISEIFSTLWKF